MKPPEEDRSSPDHLDSFDPLLGRLVAGNFRIERLIGQGAMGNVYRAEQLSLGKAVAVKVLHAHLMADEKLVGRFKREAKSASRLNHPNSIQIIDSGQDTDGTLFIAMELLPGRDLAQVIRDEFPISLPRVVRIMTQVMSALDEAHAQGVIHRDLKPSNIMLIERRGEKDFVKVCDFGIAKATSPDGKDDDRQQMLTIQGLVCGTPEYMSPEQARAETLDGRADLYSAAIILYQLVTGDIPFRADSPMGIVSRHLAEVAVRPSQRRPDLPIPKAMDDLIMRGMEKDRLRRFASAVDFRAALEAVVSPTPGQYTPFPPGVPQASIPTTNAIPGATAIVPPMSAADKFGTTADLTSERPGKHRALRGVLVAALLLGAGAAAALVVKRSPPAPQPAVSQAAQAAPPPAPAPVVIPVVAVTPPPAPDPVAAAPAEGTRSGGRARSERGAGARAVGRARRLSCAPPPWPRLARGARPRARARTAQRDGRARPGGRRLGHAAARGRAAAARRPRGARRGRQAARTGRGRRRLRARRGGQAPEPQAARRLQVPRQVLHAGRPRRAGPRQLREVPRARPQRLGRSVHQEHDQVKA